MSTPDRARSPGALSRVIRAEASLVGFDWRITAIVAWTSLALTLDRYHRFDWYWSLLARAAGEGPARYLEFIGLGPALFLATLAPFVLIVLMGERLRDYGLGLGDWRIGLRLSALFLALYAPLFVIFFTSRGFQDFYGHVAPHMRSWHAFWVWGVPAVFFFMLKTEFVYRGFLLFGFARRYGPYAGIAASSVPFVMIHFGKPELETLGALPVGLALAYLAVRTRSIWYGLLLHWTIALAFAFLVLVAAGPR